MNDTPIPDLSFLKPPAKSKGPTCPSCRFMARDGKQMTCRRQPPTACVVLIPIQQTRMGPKGLETGMGMQPQTVTAWPLVMDDWWCGEFAPTVAAPSDRVFPLPPLTAPTAELAESLRRMEASEPHPSTLPRMEGDDRE